MRASYVGIVLVLVAVGPAALPACTPTPPVTVVRLEPGSEQKPIRGDKVKLKRGAQEAFAGTRGGFFVVRNAEDWEHAWPGDKAPPMPAGLDTSKQMLLLAAGESKAVTQTRVERALETATMLYVWVRETTLGEGCVDKAKEPAFDAVVAARADKPVKVFVDRAPGESCGEPPTARVECRLAGAELWSTELEAQPGDMIECALSTSVRGSFELVDRLLSVAELPPGSSAKLAFKKGPDLARIELDVYGTYTLSAEAADEAGRRGKGSATIVVKPPKTEDVLVQLVWAGFDRKDESDTFPRVNLRVAEEGPQGQRCSADVPVPGLCDVKTRGAYTYMRIPAGSRKLPVSVQYLDERAEKGPGPCVHVWLDGERTTETCDRKHRDADEIWRVGVLDTASGKIAEDEGRP